MSRVNAFSFFFFFFRDMTTDFRGNGYSKNRLICDCDGEPTHAITALLAILANSLLYTFSKEFEMERFGRIAFTVNG